MSNIQPVTPHADDELLTIQEVADVVRVPVATLRYWRHVASWLISGSRPSST
jgi:hypothetical protein